MEELRFSEYCANCRQSLEHCERILFVEKEVGRCFCTEDCIKEYFQPTVDFMHEEWQKLRPEHDFTSREAGRFTHYRQLTLEDPDEIWVDSTELGERHYTFLSHFRHEDERVTYIVVCLAIDGVPSFVFLSFVTRDEDLVDEYRRGEELREVDAEAAGTAEEAPLESLPPGEAPESPLAHEPPHEPQEPGDQTYFERLYDDLRQPGDIPRDLFERFDGYVETTVDEPDEIWRFKDEDGREWFTFISRYTVEGARAGEGLEQFCTIVVCSPVASADGRATNLEVVFTFPTVDPALVQHFRKGLNSLNKAFGVGWARGRAA